MRALTRVATLASVDADIDATLRPDNYDVVRAFNKQLAMRAVTEDDRAEYAKVYCAKFESAVRP
jgi:hypothetical protein